MNILGERIKYLRKQVGLNQIELANALNREYGLKVDRVMVSKWETGFQTPVISTIKNIAALFEVSLDYLTGESDKNERMPAPVITENYTTFPVIGEVAAGYDSPALEDWEGETVDIPNSYLRGRNRDEFFVLKVKGDSMYPEYQDGDKVLVLKQTTLNYSGQVGVVLYDSELATLKKVEYNSGEDWMRFVAINPAYPPRTIYNEELELCRVLGIPKLLIREIES
ncbi:MAG: helix-turn-helix domain-containing protein [Clostridia bacterium]|nr:helix-turn-helix domain-containing protein [Clostridia bacterium]